MKKNKFLFILFLIIFSAGLGTNILRNSQKTSPQPSEDLKSVLPEAEFFTQEQTPLPHYKAYKTISSGRKDLIGLAYLTTDIVPEEKGFAGPIKILVGMNLNGEIEGAKILSHNETSTYVTNLDEFTRQFKGLNTNSGFEVGKNIDGITRATITSKAITRAIEKSLKIMADSVLKLEITAPEPEVKPLPISQILFPVLLFSLAIVSLLTRNTFARWASLLSSLVYLGFLRSTMISVSQISNLGLLKFPTFADSPLWFLLFGLTLVTLLLLGNIYCGSICPFGPVEEIIHGVFKKLGVKTWKPSARLDFYARHLKYLVLFTALIISFLVGSSDPVTLEPFLTLFTAHASQLAWGFLFFMLFLAIFNFRFWCKYLCPIGALNGLIAQFSLFKIRLFPTCVNCLECEKVCPVDAIKPDKNNQPYIDYPECILCGQCMQKCPRGSLKLDGKRHAKK